MIEQNQLIFGQIVKLGYQNQFVEMGIRNVTINQHQEEVKQGHKEERDPTKEVKYPTNYVTRY